MRYLATDQQFERTLGTLYDCALSPAVWPQALASLARLFNSAFADNYSRTHDRSWERGLCHGIDAADYQEKFLKEWSKRNVWGLKRPVTEAGEVLSTREILSRDELVRSEMFQDYLAPRGLHEGMRLSIWSGKEGIEDVSLLRPFSMTPFGRNEVALATALLPHLRRVATISRGLRASAASSFASTMALDHVHQPILLLNGTGSVMYANPAALDLLRQADGLQSAQDGLAGATPDTTARLRAALWQAAGGNGPPGSGTVRLPRPSGKPPLALTALPLAHDLDWRLPQQPSIVLFVADSYSSRFQPGQQLATTFGLTAAEAALADELLTGDDLARIAERSGRSVHTVRTHLARLMAKTGTARQSDLVRIMLGFPGRINDRA